MEHLLKTYVLMINLKPLLHLSGQPVPVMKSKASGFDEGQGNLFEIFCDTTALYDVIHCNN